VETVQFSRVVTVNDNNERIQQKKPFSSHPTQKIAATLLQCCNIAAIF